MNQCKIARINPTKFEVLIPLRKAVSQLFFVIIMTWTWPMEKFWINQIRATQRKFVQNFNCNSCILFVKFQLVIRNSLFYCLKSAAPNSHIPTRNSHVINPRVDVLMIIKCKYLCKRIFLYFLQN